MIEKQIIILKTSIYQNILYPSYNLIRVIVNYDTISASVAISKLLVVQQQQEAIQQQQPAAAFTIRHDDFEVNLLIFIISSCFFV